MLLTWTFSRTPTRLPLWHAEGYHIESSGYNQLSAKTGAEKGRRVGGGYKVYRDCDRQCIGTYSQVADAKARAQRDSDAR